VLAVEVWAFARANLPPPPARVLEVGAGDGALARGLTAAGYEVLAIDPEPSGESVLPVALHEFEHAPAFDAALAVVSLHHVEPLEQSCRRLGELVRPGGALLVDELDVDAFDERAAAWLLAQWRLLGDLHEETSATAIVADLREHIHPVSRIVAALEADFDLAAPVRGSYLYRWNLPESLRAAEEALIAQGALPAVGVRFVGRRQ